MIQGCDLNEVYCYDEKAKSFRYKKDVVRIKEDIDPSIKEKFE